ncbi:GTPase family protein [Citrobacter freundii]|uniref:GTPase family protein n=1 Tax=Enterobacteriaceae TaxID=543 RepID=UPI001A31539F|nr:MULTISPECIES: GTPase family protein [Enterobacteriaceae]HBV2140831.1 GTPase family protein [Klebsiella variicola]HDU5014852.1 GTPase family protein [Klebsiella quasipneumoniae subsp. quasipneumoniae]HDX8627838.1 GTPase family protein [Klebsiella michiganensis]HEP1898926.1 GTPase family protein [Kluyvera cryocrescens]MCO5617098.1 GTPase family protein [Citrobacter freundii]
MNNPEGTEPLQHSLSGLPHWVSERILQQLNQLTSYEPVIGIMGKTGAGKSSLCNALFAGDVSPVSDVSACTRAPQRCRLRVGRHSMVLVDLPGVGESEVRDREYQALYRRQLPQLDLVLWVIKADDRALSVDERFYREVIGSHRHKVLFVVNQVDKLEPCHEWDATCGSPSSRQKINLSRKLSDIRQLFTPSNPMCAVSARTGWGLGSLVETMMRSLPARASSPLSAQLHETLRSEPVKSQARDRFGEAAGEVVDAVASLPFVPEPVKSLIRSVRDMVVSTVRAVWDFFF